MTPTQVIATMKASLVDELDENRPQFTSSARVGAWVAIMGVPSFDKLKELSNILKTVKKLFGVSHTEEEIHFGHNVQEFESFQRNGTKSAENLQT